MLFFGVSAMSFSQFCLLFKLICLSVFDLDALDEWFELVEGAGDWFGSGFREQVEDFGWWLLVERWLD